MKSDAYLRGAAKDLAEIEAYISLDSPDAAKAVASRLRKAFDLHCLTTRGIGRPTPDRPDIREWSVPGLPYIIPYRVAIDIA